MILLWIILAVLVLILLLSLIIFLIVQHKSRFVIAQVKPDHPLYEDGEKFLSQPREDWTITTKDGLTLHAWYLAAERPTAKTVILANGYHSQRDRFAAFGWLFHKLGYNVLMPAYRASAEAEGKYIGFGWLDRDDYLRWMDEIIRRQPDAKIAMFGISMGASTTMMVSGEHLPEQVKCFIADCGYDTLWNEIVFKAKHDFHLPAFPLVYLMSFWSKHIAGYSYKETSTLGKLAQNRHPILFIHGEKDEFVPTEMVYRNFEATSAEKELFIVPNAGHAQAYETDIESYRQTVQKFLDKHF